MIQFPPFSQFYDTRTRMRVALALDLKELIVAKAKANQKLSEDRGQKGTQIPAEVFKPINTREELAKAAGVSHDTIRKVEHFRRILRKCFCYSE